MWPVIATWGLAGQSELVQVGEGLQDEVFFVSLEASRRQHEQVRT